MAEILSQASAPLQSITNAHRKSRTARAEALAAGEMLPSEVLAPTASFQPRGATYPGEIPPHPVTLRPQGFSPSRRFAPLMAYRAYFIPVPLMGSALRGLAPSAGAVRSLEHRVPLGVGEHLGSLPLLQGFSHHRGPARRCKG